MSRIRDREVVNAAARRYYQRHKDTVLTNYRSWRQRHTEKWMLSCARRRAKKHGRDFNLVLEDIVIPERCPVLGIPLRRDAEKWGDDVPSLDRVDSSRGYVRGNVRVISRRANLLKSNATVEEVRALLRYVEAP